jgi:tryptophan-rich sensory protein
MLNSKARDITGLIVCLAACFAAAGVGSLAMVRGGQSWYAQPSWAPPDWVFGPVWTVLYALMAVAVWRVWRAPGAARRPLGLFGLQLVLNALWPWLFFAARNPGAAFVELVMLWCAILATILVFHRIDRLGAALLLPYLAWVTYAAALNLAIFRLM